MRGLLTELAQFGRSIPADLCSQLSQRDAAKMTLPHTYLDGWLLIAGRQPPVV